MKKEKLKVKLIEEDRGHVNPERKYHFFDIDSGKYPVSNMIKEEVEHFASLFNLEII